MHNHNFKPEHAAQDGYPFICYKVPFVWRENSFIIPFVGLNKPSVGFEQNLSGFSLIELIVTLSVVSILAFVAVPSIKNILKDHRLSGYTNDLVADLNTARSEAIKRATPVTLCKTLNPQNSSPACNTTAANAWTTGRIMFVDADSDGVVDSGEQVLRLRQGLDDQNSAIKGAGNGTVTDTANRVTFRSDGTSTLIENILTAIAETQITVCDDRGATQKRALEISAGGRVRSLQKGTGSNTCP
jgi:type IV fimbrial biogenesis protein FimT